MKHKSKLFLLIALILAGIGIILLIAGAVISKVQGQSLFASDLGDGATGYVYEYEKIGGKLKLDVYDAEITILGGAEENKIEVINFNENLYTYTENEAMITVKESADMSSAFDFWDGDTAFNGLRFLPRLLQKQKNKSVRVYLKEGEGFSEIILHTEGGKISISEVDFATAYTLEINGTAVNFENINSATAVSVTDETGQDKISLSEVSSEKITLDVIKADISGKVYSDVLDIWNNSGSAKLDYTPLSFDKIYFELKSNSRITLDGAEFSASLSYPQNGEGLETDEEGNPLYAEVGITGDDLAIELETPLDKIEIETK